MKRKVKQMISIIILVIGVYFLEVYQAKDITTVGKNTNNQVAQNNLKTVAIGRNNNDQCYG